jgi:hypothetical protein
VEFNKDVDFKTLRLVVREKIFHAEYAGMDDIWLIGKHRAYISLAELQAIVDDIMRLCPEKTQRRKTAIVVDQGLTEAIFKLLSKGIERLFPFECRVFNTLEEAEEWLGVAKSKVA